MSTTSSDSDPAAKLAAKAAQFEGFGTNFKGKLIGVEDVPEARGDKMCQIAMAKLKAGVRAAGDHKAKITINVSIDGVKLIDDRTGAVSHTHPVQGISFILRDTTDSRAFGYVCGKGNGTSHQFYGIKTEKAADPLVFCLRDLFEVAFEKKKQKQEEAKKPEEEPVAVTTDANKNEVEKKTEEKKTDAPSDNLFSFDNELKNLGKNLDGVDISAASPADNSWMMSGPWENKPAPTSNQTPQNALAALMAGSGSQQMMFAQPGFGQAYAQPVVMVSPAFGGYPVAPPPVYRVPAPTGIMVSSPYPPGSWPPPGNPPPTYSQQPQPTQPPASSWATFNTSAGPPPRADPFENDPFFSANSSPMQPLAAGKTNGAANQQAKPAFDPFADLALLHADLSQKKMDKSAFTKEEPKQTLMDLSQQKPVAPSTNPFGATTPGTRTNPFSANNYPYSFT